MVGVFIYQQILKDFMQELLSFYILHEPNTFFF